LEEEILREAQEKASLIKQEAEKEAKAIIEEAEKKAEEILERAKAEAEALARELEKEERAKISIERRRIWAEAFEELYQKFLAKLRENADAVYSMKAYKEFLKRKLKEVPKGYILYMSKESQRIANVKAKELDEPGFKALSKDGSVEIDYTFSTLLQLKEPQLRALLYRKVKKG